jgi:HAD superfamily hydrolase (TIGR01509 family)
VLFDMDGTIVDTEPYWIAAEYALVEAHGGRWNDDLALSLVGNDLLVSGRIIRERGGVDLSPEQIVDHLLDAVIEQCRQAIPWRPGAQQLLQALVAEGIPCALVTMSYLRLAETVTAALPPNSFTAVVTGDQVTVGKPHPEAYLLAAERLGADPARCVAIEDSLTGVASAEAAGCVVIAVPHHVSIPPADTRTIVTGLAELSPERLRQMVQAAGAAARPAR